MALKGILRKYEVASSQCVNYDKSTIYFSSNIEDEIQQAISKSLGFVFL